MTDAACPRKTIPFSSYYFPLLILPFPRLTPVPVPHKMLCALIIYRWDSVFVRSLYSFSLVHPLPQLKAPNLLQKLLAQAF